MASPSMRWVEIAKFSSLLAFSDAIDDMDDYYLYFLIALSRYGCDCTGWILGLLLLSKTFFYFLAKPGAGWLVDATTNCQHLTLIWSGICQLVSSLVFIYFGHSVNIAFLIAIYLAHKACIQVNATALWKVVKFRTQFIYGKENVEGQEVIISFIGVMQGIISDIYETVALALTFVIIKNGHDFTEAHIFIYCTIIFGNVYIALISLTITKSSLYTKETDPNFQPLLGEGRLDSDIIAEDKEDMFFGVKVGETPNVTRGFFGKTLQFFIERLKSFFGFRLALHAIIMSWILYTFTNMIEYPITFAESNLPDDDASSGSIIPEPPCNHAGIPTNTTFLPVNFCQGHLKNLIQESMTDNVAYAIGSALYLVFLVKCPSRWFYHFVFPAVSIISAIMVVLLWTLSVYDLAGKSVIYIIKAFLLTVPYYMEKYNFYFWTSAIDEKYFGFYYGTYGLIQNAIHTTSSFLLAGYSDSLTPTSPLFSGLLALNFCLIIFDYGYCMVFARNYRRVLFAPPGDHSAHGDITGRIPDDNDVFGGVSTDRFETN